MSETGKKEPGSVRGERLRPGAMSALLKELVRAPEPRPDDAREQAFRPGAVVGRFELVREVGRGGFGVVFEARDRRLKRTVALKAIRRGGRVDLRQERLLAEAEAAARCSHPNIVTVHDVGHTEHGPYLVLEFLRGETLARRLEHGLLTVNEALGVAVEVAKGLAHAHELGVVHRDLTPGNVFLCQDGQVKVLDLGMAHAFGRRKVDGGTAAYMAPEQWREAPEDERTDVFALGVMLYRMLSGELPFAGDQGRSVCARGRTPRLEIPSVPLLGPLVSRMLAKDPTERIRDAGAVRAALEPLLEKLQAGGSGTGNVSVRAPRRRAASTATRRAASVAVLPFAT